MAKFNQSKDISEIPKANTVRVWNLTNNSITLVDKHYMSLIDKSREIPKNLGQNRFSDFDRDNYIVDDFQGSKRNVKHMNHPDFIEHMTNSLFDEIKRRNPPDPNIKDTNGNPYEYWKEFLYTEDDIRANQATKKVDPKDALIEKMAAKLDKLEAGNSNSAEEGVEEVQNPKEATEQPKKRQPKKL